MEKYGFQKELKSKVSARLHAIVDQISVLNIHLTIIIFSLVANTISTDENLENKVHLECSRAGSDFIPCGGHAGRRLAALRHVYVETNVELRRSRPHTLSSEPFSSRHGRV